MSIDVRRRGKVTLITINRPEAANALTLDLRDALERELNAFDEDPDSVVGILTGAGDRVFCAGADLKSAPSGSDRSLVGDIGTAKPLIAAVNGHALGGGLELALTCDIRIAAETATFGLPEVKIGSMPGSGGTQRLTRLIGLGPALYLGLTGDPISAREAKTLGLISAVVAAGEVLSAAERLALTISERAPLSLKAVKRAMREGLDLPLERGLRLERSLFNKLKGTDDRKEGRLAFKEKRRPVFKGR
ncbi:MAG: enoyl-CoA hydratase-related protein [Sphingomonadales bacterium]|nr:enoyl-CoA hydratase-related protein [Sphingomonadales bacterium]